MNMSNHYQQPIIFYLVFIVLVLMGTMSSTSVYSDETNTSSGIPINVHKTPGTTNNSIEVQTKHVRKTVMIEESRGLSAFFIFGIAINIIMAVTFAWWFSREWRRSKNKGSPTHE